jgi:DNA excision repair protein ERCC-4
MIMRLQPTSIYTADLKPALIPKGFILVQDTREQRPLFSSPPNDLEVISKALPYGDYSIRGFEDRFCIERKQMSDFYGYIGKEHKRTIRKMEQFRDMVTACGWAGLAVEATEADLLTGFVMSRVSPETARQALVSFEVRYGVHVYYSRSRRDIARWVLDRAIKFYRIQREVAG